MTDETITQRVEAAREKAKGALLVAAFDGMRGAVLSALDRLIALERAEAEHTLHQMNCSQRCEGHLPALLAAIEEIERA